MCEHVSIVHCRSNHAIHNAQPTHANHVLKSNAMHNLDLKECMGYVVDTAMVTSRELPRPVGLGVVVVGAFPSRGLISGHRTIFDFTFLFAVSKGERIDRIGLERELQYPSGWARHGSLPRGGLSYEGT